MKKLLLTAVCLLGAFAANAQWYIGPQVSLNLAGMSHSSDFSAKTKTGYAFGAFGGYEISDFLAVEAQVLYSAQGAKLSGTYSDPDEGTTYEGTFTKKLNYVNVPIVAKFTFWKGLYAYAGPQFGFNVRSKIKGEGIVDGVASDDVLDVKSSTNVFDFGALIGVGYQFNCGLRAGISYCVGFSNTVKDSNSISAVFGDPSKNRTFAFTVGWRF